METGKAKNRKKYISVVLIPHFNSRVRTFKFSSPYSKLITFVSIFFLFQTAFIFTFARIYNENSLLKKNMTEISAVNEEQRNLLEEKIKEIDILVENNDKMNAAIENFMIKYQEISDTYIEDRLDNLKLNPSSRGMDRSFINDIDELKKLLDNLQKLNAVKSDKLEKLAETEKKLKDYMDSMPTLWPTTGEVSSQFGSRKDPIATWKKSFHTGLDIAADYGADIKASASGKVIMAGRTEVYGNTIEIDHGHGITTFYGHASRLLVKEGQTVKKGEVIAKVGSTGRSTGSHLHFEIRINGNAVDPLEYLDD
ncbi:hypothetical protein CDQ84_06535 [Clostridium thermosuccinogenes]|jgi:murein DD-endopeptidase MepM/ murein hydrolase activator NlpD|uniref:M23ase beta-sheet core domain-containing protein n=1 Tax=Clostridium thermosuccinogenes TaxID=84032 RepID=A0A2K2F4L5_9CLOT|nr:M23 family metallopeptidase [Pseudoclostridium thermosuccinogenes]AUS97461.1 hypothetical protein CDO33_14050 [Pseudoclostridium thermosuccinogenes]PNT93712.1 hypothetical protein CDQ83_09535 [Pseudoclostridium thermosuccinogenes]PNT98188.1 hypothetical protein CDQ85_06040 [Pseudoclostridium thermosuccinogenes]PNU00337.1 hypothetical protein CDQ84_06535 [Pseudoclostridium thermosuccinogenes]